eukprot:CAMPEP_0114234464 /NCGR_PEP_ID=MMETSP0058-20121206/5724_1 /TAXON_ID=36894 /ORGANISM="Pyramimonas parkeae, CCMP726" /LENGTH=249 /DNA_ID=CAMNT_0001346147 /DNA_START=247 /DNA_END=993 /DNA_ORIENTATION=-
MALLEATDEQNELWYSNDPVEWQAALDKYDKAISLLAQMPGKQDLLSLDRWYHEELPEAVMARCQPHLEYKELLKVIKWMRAREYYKRSTGERNKGLIPENQGCFVETLSRYSFDKICNFDKSKELTITEKEEAIDFMTEIKGVGVVTASAILAMVCPSYYPYMSGEAVATVLGRPFRDELFSFTRYVKLQIRLRAKAFALNREESEASKQEWTPANIERAIWAIEHASTAPRLPRNSIKPARTPENRW